MREALGKRFDSLHLFDPGKHAAFELEVVEAVVLVCRFSECDDGFGRERWLVTKVEPCVAVRSNCRIFYTAITEISLAAVADEEEIAEDWHAGALLALTEQCGNGLAD